MISLLRIELRKLLPYRTFWTILAIYAGLLFLIVYGASNVTINGQNAGSSFYEYPGIWTKIAYIASYFNLLLGILIIISVTDEYAFRTIRQQVIDGYSRLDVIGAKLNMVLLLGILCSLYVLALGAFFGVSGGEAGTAQMYSGAQGILYYLIQAIGYMSLAMLFGFLIRKSGLAILAFLIYAKIAEPMIHYNIPDQVDKYFPMKVFSSLTPMPGKELFDIVTGASESLTPAQAFIPAVFYSLFFCFLSYMILRARDL